MPSEAAIEKEIQDKGLNAPRLTPEHIDALIFTEHYFNPKHDRDPKGPPCPLTDAALGCLTICVLVLRNGFTIVGKSACASPENFDAELGRKIAREDARRQIWPLAGYALRERLMAEKE